MKKITMFLLVTVCAVIAFGYVSTPVQEFPPHEPNAPRVMKSKTCYVHNEVYFEIDVEDSNDDTLVVTADKGTVTRIAYEQIMVDGVPATTTITDANGTAKLYFWKSIYKIVFRPAVVGYVYPEIIVQDGSGIILSKHVEILSLKKNVAPIISGCR